MALAWEVIGKGGTVELSRPWLPIDFICWLWILAGSSLLPRSPRHTQAM